MTLKTIKYSYTDSGKADLAVVLPQAMQTSYDSKSLISLLSKIANVIFIESGYYGITKIDSLKSALQYSSTGFRKNLHTLVSKYSYESLYLVAGSVGAIHALSFAMAYPKKIKTIVLAGPALYKKKGIVDIAYKLMLNLGIALKPDFFFRLWTNLVKNETPWFEKTYHNVSGSIGALSYLLCLREIVNFTSNYDVDLVKLISRKVDVLLGNNDDAFKLTCDKNLCAKAKSCTWIDSDHSALNSAKHQIFELLSSKSN